MAYLIFLQAVKNRILHNGLKDEIRYKGRKRTFLNIKPHLNPFPVPGLLKIYIMPKRLHFLPQCNELFGPGQRLPEDFRKINQHILCLFIFPHLHIKPDGT